ncbi:hypothetical protein GDO81_004725 [Engystomops pustulosus]|uniref:Uncharacterized protein n=1 Tax=Engystomops pustulosus TaxID=76066 RepID=A0AAV7CI14_ENGPU|nr:hypothetical protein GDO81_004725 [Engystomops pustulosus]KAG8584697.1 hypothetical protein GDO81_004725 [Engystomops pustulosus]KAG8584698.1 hypothetical protein GDO81_004725 [Engystomops pustulosus]KAG8584699.1 hypothetical protein GDO81_004725 [Engystomops pustulosus]KAG8584700.1 hypothetical protein GDO81_004725 [Engystomops pustulosus]
MPGYILGTLLVLSEAGEALKGSNSSRTLESPFGPNVQDNTWKHISNGVETLIAKVRNGSLDGELDPRYKLENKGANLTIRDVPKNSQDQVILEVTLWNNTLEEVKFNLTYDEPTPTPTPTDLRTEDENKTSDNVPLIPILTVLALALALALGMGCICYKRSSNAHGKQEVNDKLQTIIHIPGEILGNCCRRSSNASGQEPTPTSLEMIDETRQCLFRTTHPGPSDQILEFPSCHYERVSSDTLPCDVPAGKEDEETEQEPQKIQEEEEEEMTLEVL